MYCYKGTNITGERVVNHPRTQLIDALIESYGSLDKKTVARCGLLVVELLGIWMVNEANDSHFARALGADKSKAHGI